MTGPYAISTVTARLSIGEFDHRISTCQQRHGIRKDFLQQTSQSPIGQIAAGEPKDLRRRAQAQRQVDKIAVFTQDHDVARGAVGVEDR